MRIRDATPDDADAVRRVHRESITGLGTEGYSDRQVEAWAAGCESADYESSITGDGVFIVAEQQGAVVGFGSMAFDAPAEYESEADAEITGVYVHPSVAGQGVGSAIYRELEARARDREVQALTLSASLNAVPIYESHGYQRQRTYSHEFSGHEATDVEGAVVEMSKEL